MDWIWLLDTIKGCILSILKLVLIVIPLMVIIEFLKELRVVNRLTPIFLPVLKILRLPKEAVLPLIAGLIFGIAYGAGVIIQSAREEVVQKEDLYTVSLFLVVCHSLIEDTMLFLAVGANFWIILVARFLLAIIVTYTWVKLKRGRFMTQIEQANSLKYTP
ncbi:MAG: nucleoside recognition domain-containing protein [Dehalobacterium sp.]